MKKQHKGGQNVNQPMFGAQIPQTPQAYTGQLPPMQGTGQMPPLGQYAMPMPPMQGTGQMSAMGQYAMPSAPMQGTGQMTVAGQYTMPMPPVQGTGQIPAMGQYAMPMPPVQGTGQIPAMGQYAMPMPPAQNVQQPAAEGPEAQREDGANALDAENDPFTGAVPLGGAGIPGFGTGEEESAEGAENGASNAAADDVQHRFTPSFEPGQSGPSLPKRRKRMSGFQLWLILLVVLGTGIYVWWSLSPVTASTAVIEAGTLGAHYAGSALIVRQEVPFEAESVTSIVYSAQEGKEIKRGVEICKVYSAGYSIKEMNTLQDYRDQIRDYQLNVLKSESTYDARMERVNNDVLSRAREVRSILAGGRGNLINQERLLNAAIEARQQYISSKYATDQRMSRLNDDAQAQRQRIDSWTKQYAATTDAIVSFYSDGFEYSLTMNNYADFSPAQVRKMIEGQKPEISNTKMKTTIYRTIRDGEWVALFLVDKNDQSWNPVEGQTYMLQLERFENTQVMATVETFTRTGGELLVRLRVNASVEPVLYMRSCQATLGDQIATLKVPSRAIYQQDGMNGVVVIYGGTETFIPIQLVYEQDHYAYITAVTSGLLFEGQTVLLF